MKKMCIAAQLRTKYEKLNKSDVRADASLSIRLLSLGARNPA